MIVVPDISLSKREHQRHTWQARVCIKVDPRYIRQSEGGSIAETERTIEMPCRCHQHTGFLDLHRTTSYSFDLSSLVGTLDVTLARVSPSAA